MKRDKRENIQPSVLDIHMPLGKTYGAPLSLLYPYESHPHCFNHCNPAYSFLNYRQTFYAHSHHQQLLVVKNKGTNESLYKPGMPNPTRAQDIGYHIYGPLLYIYGISKLKQSTRVQMSLNFLKKSRSISDFRHSIHDAENSTNLKLHSSLQNRVSSSKNGLDLAQDSWEYSTAQQSALNFQTGAANSLQESSRGAVQTGDTANDVTSNSALQMSIVGNNPSESNVYADGTRQSRAGKTDSLQDENTSRRSSNCTKRHSSQVDLVVTEISTSGSGYRKTSSIKAHSNGAVSAGFLLSGTSLAESQKSMHKTSIGSMKQPQKSSADTISIVKNSKGSLASLNLRINDADAQNNDLENNDSEKLISTSDTKLVFDQQSLQQSSNSNLSRKSDASLQNRLSSSLVAGALRLDYPDDLQASSVESNEAQSAGKGQQEGLKMAITSSGKGEITSNIKQSNNIAKGRSHSNIQLTNALLTSTVRYSDSGPSKNGIKINQTVSKLQSGTAVITIGSDMLTGTEYRGNNPSLSSRNAKPIKSKKPANIVKQQQSSVGGLGIQKPSKAESFAQKGEKRSSPMAKILELVMNVEPERHSRSASSDSSTWTRPLPHYLAQYTNLRHFQQLTNALSDRENPLSITSKSLSYEKATAGEDMLAVQNDSKKDILKAASTTHSRYYSSTKLPSANGAADSSPKLQNSIIQDTELSLDDVIAAHKDELEQQIEQKPEECNAAPVVLAGTQVFAAQTRRKRGVSFLKQIQDSDNHLDEKVAQLPLLKLEAEFFKNFAVTDKIDTQSLDIKSNLLVHVVDGHERRRLAPELRQMSSGTLIKFLWNAYNYIYRYIEAGKAFRVTPKLASQIDQLHAAFSIPTAADDDFRAAVYRFIGVLEEKDFLFLKIIVEHLCSVLVVFQEDIATALGFLFGPLFLRITKQPKSVAAEPLAAHSSPSTELPISMSPTEAGTEPLLKSNTLDLMEKMDLEFLKQVVKDEAQLAAFFSNEKTNSMLDIEISMKSTEMQNALKSVSVTSLLDDTDAALSLQSPIADKDTNTQQPVLAQTPERFEIASFKNFVATLVSHDLVQSLEGAAFEYFLKHYRQVFQFNTFRAK